MVRTGLLALSTTATAFGYARLKYGSTDLSQRPLGASTIWAFCCSGQAFNLRAAAGAASSNMSKAHHGLWRDI
jgi:hypothetical protein